MNGEVQIDTAAVLACATALTAIGDQVAHGAAAVPDPPPSSGVWHTGPAVAHAGEQARAHLHTIGAEIVAAARQVAATVTDYEDADARAASRLRGVR
jgi:hypothetical protein